MSGRYETFAPRLVQNNWDVTPVNGKRAILSGWATRPATALEYHNHSHASIGVLTGGQFNIVAVDVDILNQIASDALHKLAEDCLGFAPRRIGRAPKFLLLYRCSEAVRKTKTGVYTIDDDSAAVEILAEGQQFVAAGVHPDTKQKYEWPGDSILDLTPDDLTVVTPEQLDTFLGSAASVLSQYGVLKGRVSERSAVPAVIGGLSFTELAGEAGEVKAALACLPNADEHYDDWISTLHAIKGAMGNDTGRDLAHCWSRRSDKYDEGETNRAWNSITQVRHIGAGSIFHWASSYGFDLKALRTPQHEGPKDVAREEEFDPLAGIIQASEIRGPVPDRKWMLDQWFPARAVSLLFGPGGVGKTLLVQQLANCVATGQQFMGIDTHQMPVLAVLCEDDALEISRRQLSINEWLGVNEITGTGPQDLYIWPRVGEDNILVTYPSQGEGQPGAFYGLLKQGVERVQQQTGSEAILVILDTAADMYGGNENVRREVNTFIKTYLGSFCVNHNATVLVLAHPSLSGLSTGSGLSGSTAWENSVRARAYFHRSEDGDDIRILSRKKSNYSASGDGHDITLLWDKGVYQLPAEPDQVDRIEQRALKNKVIAEVQNAFRKGAGYRKQGPRSYKTALAPIVNETPARVTKVVNQMYADAVFGYDEKKGFFEL